MRTFVVRVSLSTLAVAMCHWNPVMADEIWTASVHVGTADVSRVVKDDGPWWNDVDDDATAWGVSLTYALLPTLGLRVMHERANDLAAQNLCPPATAICPALSIREEVDFTAWHLALVPRYELTRDWSVFGTVGAKYWELERDDMLPDDSSTAFTYGAGITWRGLSRIEMGIEYQGSRVDYDVVRLNLGFRF